MGKHKEVQYFKRLDILYQSSPTINITENDKIAVFSDLHLGDGSANDDFLQNSSLFIYVLMQYYYKRGYKLILNGDIEELYKFKLETIAERWREFYNLLELFRMDGRLFKIIGNHDFKLQGENFPSVNSELLEAVKLSYKNSIIFVYHGHQTSSLLEQYNKFSQCLIRYVVSPLGIKNVVEPMESAKKYITEVRAYGFASSKKIISILGHTHRPLFESLSKLDDLKIKIETLIRKYPKADGRDRKQIEKSLRKYKIEFDGIIREKKENHLRSSLYNERALAPCLFNSGSVIGKRGSTCIEINNGMISLNYWFDRNYSQRYLNYKGVRLKRLNKSNYYKATLKEQSLEYVFTKIRLLL